MFLLLSLSSKVVLTCEFIDDTNDVILSPVLAVAVQHLEGIGQVTKTHRRLLLVDRCTLTHLIPLDLI